ncbi:hypothetical protein HOK22_01025 [Candidatus Peregrinibacteria bacterium]|nr:hypothetical protein [Candidatus Peregrinibacteria bacterium]
MKNSFFTIAVAFLIALTGYTFSTLANVEESLIDRIFDEAKVVREFDNTEEDLDELANQSKYAFENLHLFMYQNAKIGPQDAAIEYIGITHQDYTTDEIRQIVLEDDVSPILFKQMTPEELATAQLDLDKWMEKRQGEWQKAKENGGFDSDEEFIEWLAESEAVKNRQNRIDYNFSKDTQEFVMSEYSKILDEYRERLSFEKDSFDLAFSARATELFYNNDLSDSAGIDILFDLDIINFLLFGKYITYPDRSGDEDVELASVQLVERAYVEPKVVLAEEDAPISDPYVCSEDADLKEALSEFEEFIATLPAEEAAQFDAGIAADLGDADVDEDGEIAERLAPPPPEDVEIAGGVHSVPSSSLDRLDESLVRMKREKGDWNRGLPCNEIFCITINLVTGTWGTTENTYVEEEFEEDQNCVACHVSYINESMEETLSKSLVPNKVSMNWFEDATCKEAGNEIALDFNIYGVKQPIVLDPGDELDSTAAEATEALTDRWVQLGILPFAVGSRGNPEKTMIQLDRERRNNLTKLAGVSQTQENALIEESQSASDVLAAGDNAKLDILVNYEGQTSYNFYKQFSGELSAMLSVFESYDEALKSSYFENDAPLKKLIETPYCK